MFNKDEGEQWEWAFLTRPDHTKKRKSPLRRAKRILHLQLHPTLPHFRWKQTVTSKKRIPDQPGMYHYKSELRLYLCVGGDTIAAWPKSDDGCMMALVLTKMFIDGKDKNNLSLSREPEKIRRMALRLRKVLLKAEKGTRAKSARRQRRNIERVYRLGEFRPQVLKDNS